MLVVTVAVVGVAKYSMSPGLAFHAGLWSDPARIDDGVRLGMADRLLAEGTLIGLARTQVVAMLGEPPPSGYFSIDSEWLVVRLGPEDRVVQACIVMD